MVDKSFCLKYLLIASLIYWPIFWCKYLVGVVQVGSVRRKLHAWIILIQFTQINCVWARCKFCCFWRWKRFISSWWSLGQIHILRMHIRWHIYFTAIHWIISTTTLRKSTIHRSLIWPEFVKTKRPLLRPHLTLPRKQLHSHLLLGVRLKDTFYFGPFLSVLCPNAPPAIGHISVTYQKHSGVRGDRRSALDCPRVFTVHRVRIFCRLANLCGHATVHHFWIKPLAWTVFAAANIYKFSIDFGAHGDRINVRLLSPGSFIEYLLIACMHLLYCSGKLRWSDET